MQPMVNDVVHRLRRQDWWARVHAALDETTVDEVAEYQREADGLGPAAADGLHAD